MWKEDKEEEDESKNLSGRKIKKMKMRGRKIKREDKSMREKEEHSLMVK